MDTKKELLKLMEELDELLCDAIRKYDEVQSEYEELAKKHPEQISDEFIERGDAMAIEINAFREVMEVLTQELEE